MQLHLKDSVALVVGGASGIGKASVDGFLDEGARVVIWDIAPVAAKTEEPDRCVAFQVDISDLAAVKRATAETESLVGSVSHLVHAAAIGSGKYGFPFTNLEPQDWTRILEVNVTGMVNVAHNIGPHMVRHGSGTMVFVASVAGQIGSPTDPPYSASKAANINFAQVMARDLAASGVRVNTVCPGMVKTPLNRLVWQSWNDRQPADGKLSYEEWGDEKVQKMIPLGTWQQPEDIADMILFLSSRRAAQVTGQTINVDGGFVMHW
jgi:2-hydroxycyclohexanecarboxyl-CoA dehydrogenase